MKTASNTDITPSRVRTGTALRSRGRHRVKKILKVARKLLITRGYPSFSLRNVAQAAGISLGNLSYYFESKDDLFRSMLDDMLEAYRTVWREPLSKAPTDPQARFLTCMDYQLIDIRNAESRQFSYQVWAISVHDPFVAQCRENAYAQFYDITRQLCADVNPKLIPNVLNQRAYLLMALIEGLYVLFGNEKTRPTNKKKFNEQFRQQALALVLAD